MATLNHSLFGAVYGLALLGCGDPLVDRQFRGDPLITIRGNVMGSSDALPLDRPVLRLSVWWSPVGLSIRSHSELVEQPSISTQSTVPFSFTLNVFDQPAQGHWTAQPDGSRYAIGTLMGYYDQNDNGRRDDDEAFLATTRRLLLFAPQPLAISESPLGRALDPGYYLTSNSFVCPLSAEGPPRSPPPMKSGQDCSLRVGQACTQDADCAPGICIRDFVSPWPQGGCVLPDPLPAACSSQGVVRVASAEASGMRRDPSYWVKACARTEDCGRAFPYQCDASLGACLPTQVATATLGDSLPPPHWCRLQ